jgi:hypothetical protein
MPDQVIEYQMSHLVHLIIKFHKISSQKRGPDNTPGSTYIPLALGSDTQKSSLSYRHAEGRDSRLNNPGLGADSIIAKFANEAYKYTLYQRTCNQSDETL